MICLHYAWIAHPRPEEGTEVTKSSKPPFRCWESNQGPVEEQSVLIPAEPCEPQVLCP